MTETKVRHPGTGKAADVAEMVITDAEGRGKEVLALNLGSRPIYRKNWEVALALVGCTAETSGNAQWLKPWSCVIEPLAGHQQLPWNTKVTMGGVDITASVYDKATGQVSIPNVTGDIAIEAEAVMMSSEYEPVEYVASIVRNGNNYYPLGFQPTYLTELELDFLSYQRSQSLIVCPSNMAASANVNNYSKLIYWSPWSASGSIYGKFLFGNGRNASLRHTPPAPNVRFKVYIGKGKIAYDDWEYDTEDDSEWSTSTVHYMFGRAGVSASVCFDGEIYGVKHCEDEVLAHRYMPCRRLSDGHVGLYDVVNGNVLSILSPTYQIAPHIITTRNYTGCIAERLSAAITGTAARAVIGSTWQIKITPSSGYTFTGGTTPQVLIDGIDVSSQVVTDNGDGTYNVTIANVEDKPIEITAVAVSDGTANATNSVTPMGGNTEEEEM